MTQDIDRNSLLWLGDEEVNDPSFNFNFDYTLIKSDTKSNYRLYKITNTKLNNNFSLESKIDENNKNIKTLTSQNCYNDENYRYESRRYLKNHM